MINHLAILGKIPHAGNMDCERKRQEIEIAILRLIQQKLENGQMDAQRASQIAKLVLKVLPKGISLEDIYRTVPTLGDQFSELSEVVLPILKEYEEKVEKIVKQRVETMVKQGKFSHASKLAQKLTNKQIALKKS